MKIEASLNNYRRSASKVREAVRVIKGLDANEALWQLDQLARGDAGDLKNLLKSAISNAENNFNLDKNNLYVLDLRVGEGATLKRWSPRAYGRAARILKRTCHITIILEEKEPSKKLKQSAEGRQERREDRSACQRNLKGCTNRREER